MYVTMSKSSDGAGVCASITAVVLTCLMCVAAPASSADQAVTNRQVAKHLTEAKKLAGSKRWDDALAALDAAAQVPEASSYAEYKIDEFRGYIFTRQNRYADAAGVFERLAQFSVPSRAKRAAHLKTASQLYMQAKQYERSARAAERAALLRPHDTTLLELAGQARYLAGDHWEAVEMIAPLVAATERAGKRPKEEWLQILLNSYYRVDDPRRVAQTWEALLRNHPKPEYWRSVLSAKAAEPRSEQLGLYYLALKLDVGILDEPEGYEALALGALDVALPADAVRVLDQGFRKGIFAGASQARFERMLTHAQAEAAKSGPVLDELARQARRASTGQSDVAVGRAHLSRENYAEAIAALRRGLEKGQLSDPDRARIDLGVAYLKSGREKASRESLLKVSVDSEWRDLAELWALRATETQERNETAQR